VGIADWPGCARNFFIAHLYICHKNARLTVALILYRIKFNLQTTSLQKTAIMWEQQENKRSLTVEKVREFYQKKGEEISVENAEKVLNLLYFLAKLVVENYLKQ
jgi:hypothetical protein